MKIRQAIKVANAIDRRGRSVRPDTLRRSETALFRGCRRHMRKHPSFASRVRIWLDAEFSQFCGELAKSQQDIEKLCIPGRVFPCNSDYQNYSQFRSDVIAMRKEIDGECFFSPDGQVLNVTDL